MNRQESQEKDKDNCRVLVSYNNVGPAEKTPLGEVNADGKKRVNDPSLHSQRENRTDQRRQGKHQLFSTITRVQGVGHIPDMSELWVENVTALQRPFSQLPCYRAINLHVERSGLGKADETHLPVTGGRRKSMPLLLKSQMIALMSARVTE